MISGAAVVDNICDTIRARLLRSDDLRGVDSYSGFGARITIDLQLHDCDEREVSVEQQVGIMESGRPSQHIEFDTAVMAATGTNMERTVEGGEPTPTPKRVYVSAIRGGAKQTAAK